MQLEPVILPSSNRNQPSLNPKLKQSHSKRSSKQEEEKKEVDEPKVHEDIDYDDEVPESFSMHQVVAVNGSVNSANNLSS